MVTIHRYVVVVASHLCPNIKINNRSRRPWDITVMNMNYLHNYSSFHITARHKHFFVNMTMRALRLLIPRGPNTCWEHHLCSLSIRCKSIRLTPAAVVVKAEAREFFNVILGRIG